ncbi:LOW QUALITY PROTEIN: molybdate-anion transporter-like [Amphiura filiformis]|uniref:LOW QUALITY PROTEIN: molybdate-anion transporter-like n=1 Tax=Amphiura filiformis TaxID=82378 RepID=UPI003B21EDF9
MIILAYSTFALLAFPCVALHFLTSRGKAKESSGNNPNFVNFQKQYFLAYFLALSADWLQGPYLYKLYSHYGFLESQIAILYVCGFASSVVFGTATGLMADRFGRRKLCITFSLVYSVSCLTKLSRNYGVLIIGRILGGVSTSLLFSAFEAWYVHEHIETHDFPTEWLPITFTRATFWNGVLAIVAGVVANFFAGTLNLGPVAPFVLAIPFLLASGAIVAQTWNENYAQKKVKFSKTCGEGLRHVFSNKRIMLIGAMQSLFESVMYIFVFLWTGARPRRRDPPLGIIFSNFMICIMIGSSLYQILTNQRYSAQLVVNMAIIMALVSMVICVGSTKPLNEHSQMSYLAFLFIEIACGLYFPAMGYLRSRYLPETHRASIMNWFRVPLNLIACIGLMILHDDPSKSGTRHIFILCSILLSVALFCGLRFTVLVKDDSAESVNGDVANSSNSPRNMP